MVGFCATYTDHHSWMKVLQQQAGSELSQIEHTASRVLLFLLPSRIVISFTRVGVQDFQLWITWVTRPYDDDTGTGPNLDLNMFQRCWSTSQCGSKTSVRNSTTSDACLVTIPLKSPVMIEPPAAMLQQTSWASARIFTVTCTVCLQIYTYVVFQNAFYKHCCSDNRWFFVTGLSSAAADYTWRMTN